MLGCWLLDADAVESVDLRMIMSAACARAILLVSLAATGEAFTVRSSPGVGRHLPAAASCRTDLASSSSYSRHTKHDVGVAEAHRQGGERSKHSLVLLATPDQAPSSSLQSHPRSRRRRSFRPQGTCYSAAATAAKTATATEVTATGIMCMPTEGRGEDLPLRQQHDQHREQQQQQQQQQRRQRPASANTRGDFLLAGASMAGFAAATLGPQAARAIDLGGIEFGIGNKNKFDIPPEDNPDGLRSPRPLAYRVEYTDPPTTVPFPKNLENNLVEEMSKNQLVFFGVHGESAVDQQTAAGVMGRVATKLKEKVAIGLEQVERQFQPALDAYVAGGVTASAAAPGPERDQADAELALATEWEQRCSFPFEIYRPVFHLARRRGLPLVALGVDSETAFQVLQSGMDSLGEQERNAYVSDFKGFVTYVRDKGFQTYADKLIFPAYDRLKAEGLLGSKPPTKPNFFAARILTDEALASKAVEWVTDNSGSPLLVLQREDHVKFGFGASGRASRIAESFGGALSAKTILINPTAQDSLSENRALRLALAYADDLYAGKPVANYLWFSKSPKINQIPRMVNPEDKGWLESVNLYDFREPAAT